MADAVCGPSNALQSFQKHTAVDRTLQQDRLQARQPPSQQGFRSNGPSANSLDQEFESFQAGGLPLAHPASQGFRPNGIPNFHTPQHFAQPGPSWVNDFQSMAISPGQQQQQQRAFSQVPIVQQPQLGGWHTEFVASQSQHAEIAHAAQHAYNAPLERLGAMPLGMGMVMHQSPMAMHQSGLYNQPLQEQFQAPQAAAETYDDELFARAFAEAEASIFAHDGQSLNDELQEAVAAASEPLQTERIGADLIHDPDRQGFGEQDEIADADALSRTAGQLLDSVSNNQSHKFKNSVFLGLMRELRDKEKVVKGDKIVDVGDGVNGIKQTVDGGGLNSSLLPQ